MIKVRESQSVSVKTWRVIKRWKKTTRFPLFSLHFNKLITKYKRMDNFVVWSNLIWRIFSKLPLKYKIGKRSAKLYNFGLSFNPGINSTEALSQTLCLLINCKRHKTAPLSVIKRSRSCERSLNYYFPLFIIYNYLYIIIIN